MNPWEDFVSTVIDPLLAVFGIHAEESTNYSVVTPTIRNTHISRIRSQRNASEASRETPSIPIPRNPSALSRSSSMRSHLSDLGGHSGTLVYN